MLLCFSHYLKKADSFFHVVCQTLHPASLNHCSVTIAGQQQEIGVSFPSRLSELCHKQPSYTLILMK